MKVYLTVDSWISIGGRDDHGPQLPFGCHDSSKQPWYRVLPSTHCQFNCVDCGKPVTRGWKRGFRGKSAAVCDHCVVLKDRHRRHA